MRSPEMSPIGHFKIGIAHEVYPELALGACDNIRHCFPEVLKSHNFIDTSILF